MKQKDIAHKAKITPSMMSQILAGKRRPSWPLSERLEKATGISAVDWIDGRVDRKYLLENYRPQRNNDFEASQGR
jgi:transcriptional regulator with XRE-family HTH domain